MPATASQATGEIEVFRNLARMAREVVRANLQGITHEESLVQPEPAGNCLNWVLGHLLWVYEGALQILGQKTVMDKGALDRYARGGPPLEDSAETLDFADLVAGWNKAVERVSHGLDGLNSEMLNRPAPFSPENIPNETVRSLLTAISFHQAYHAGQTALLRRLVGREGAIR